MLNELVHQNGDGFLSMQDKMSALGFQYDTKKMTSLSSNAIKQTAVAQRIALITDDRGLGVPLNYALDSCRQQEAKIDLLTHGTTDANNITALERSIKDAEFISNPIQLSTKAVDNVLEYIMNPPGLVFMVATPDDAVDNEITQDVIPRQGASIPVPLVLIEDNAAGFSTERCA